MDISHLNHTTDRVDLDINDASINNFMFDPSRNKTILYSTEDTSGSYVTIDTSGGHTLFTLHQNNNNDLIWNDLSNTLLNGKFYLRDDNYNPNIYLKNSNHSKPDIWLGDGRDMSFVNLPRNTVFTLFLTQYT